MKKIKDNAVLIILAIAVLLVHGEWAKMCWKAFRCSECKNISEYYTDFCPNCGADMRKEKNQNEV